MSSHLLPTLRYPRAWLFAGAVIALVVTLVSLLPAEHVPQMGVSDKIEHAVAYLLLGFWFASVTSRQDYVFLLLALAALGGGIEIAQGLMRLGRQADLRDFVADVLGSGAGILLAMTPLGRWPVALERVLARRPR